MKRQGGVLCVCRTVEDVKLKFRPGMILVVPHTNNDMLPLSHGRLPGGEWAGPRRGGGSEPEQGGHCGGHWSHPDPARRDEGLHGLPAGVCAELGGSERPERQRKTSGSRGRERLVFCVLPLRRWNGRGRVGVSPTPLKRNLGLPSRGPISWEEMGERTPEGRGSSLWTPFSGGVMWGEGCTSHGLPGLRPSQ